MLSFSQTIAVLSLCAAETCPGLGAPEEIVQAELDAMIDQVPVEQSGFLFDVEFVSYDRSLDLSQLLGDARYGVRLSYAEEICGPSTIYIFVRGPDGWSLDSQISRSGPLVCTSPLGYICGEQPGD